MSLEQLRALAEQDETEIETVAEVEEAEQEEGTQDTEAVESDEVEEEFELVLEDEPAPQEQKYTPEQAILHKLKKTKAKQKEAVAENDELKQQLAALTKTVQELQAPATQQASIQAQVDKFPDLYDSGIDGDRDKLNLAVSEYLNNQNKRAQEAAQRNSQQAQLDKAYHDQQIQLASKVGTFATENKISADKAADAVSLAVDEIDSYYGQPGAFQYLLNNLEGDSAKVAYLIGTNAGAREKLKQTLKADPSGIKAGMLLAKYEVQAKSKKQLSNAPEPDEALNGDSMSSKSGAALQKAYDEETDYMKLKAIREQAKKMGVVLK